MGTWIECARSFFLPRCCSRFPLRSLVDQPRTPMKWTTPGQQFPSTQLTVRGLDGKSITVTPDDLAAMPHETVSVYNEHSKLNEKYSGVPLTELLSKVYVPLGEKVRGKLFMIAVVAEGTDEYSVLYSLAEVDPSIHTGDVIVADSVDGKKLAKDGIFKLVSTEEKRPARWVRNLNAISAIEVRTTSAAQ